MARVPCAWDAPANRTPCPCKVACPLSPRFLLANKKKGASLSPPPPFPQAHAEITVHDDFVDESALAQLRGHFPAKAGYLFCQFMDVPRSLYDRMVGLVAPTHERKALAAAAATATSVQLPARREYKSFGEHKDLFADLSAVEQNIGLLYLKGDGVMIHP